MSSETNETQRASQPTEIDILRQEVRNQSADDIAQEAENTLQKVQELKIILQSSKKIIHQFEGTADDKESAKGKAVDVKRVVQKILLASIDNKIPVPDGADPQVQDFARLVIQKIGQHIGVENVTELTAPSLHEFLYKVVTGEITDIDSLVQEFNNIRLLSVYSSELHKNLKNAMISIAKEKGLSEEEAGEKFNILNDENKIEAYRQFSQDKWDEFSKAEQKILFALYTPEGFNDFIEEEKERIRRLTQSVGLSEEQISQKASIDIENKIMGILSRPLLKLDRGYADQSYEEIVKRDIWKGIEVTLTRLEKVLEKLQTDIQQDKVLKYKKGVYAKKEDIFYEMQQRVEDGESPEKILQMLPERQTSPFFKKEEILLSDYAHKLLLNFKVYQQIREYTHNVNAIFHRNPGKEGFYDQLANYSGRISTLIMDEINLQPDAELYRAAYQLYDKYIEEDFAAVNWIHQTTQFRASPGEAHTFVQRDIVKKLEIMFPDIKLDNPDRIISAVNIATGAARGIYMTHPEKQAYADPNLTLKGDPTFSSYSDRDAYGLIALNPQHLIYRFQAEGLMPSIFFIPIDHLEQGITWDHERLKDKIEKYKETFLKGRKGAGLSEKIFMDYLMNIGKVGGPIARAGWRIENMYRHHIRYVDGNFQLGEVDYLESWKNLENIGFHVLHDFVGGEGRHKYLKDDDFNKDLSDSESDDKKALFGYIFTKYFRDEKGEPRELSDLETYYSSLLEQAKKNAYKEIEEGKIYPEKLNEAINLEASNIFLYQTLARVVAQRIPTKLIRLERNRMSEDGERAWEKIRIQFRDNHSDDLNIDKNPIIFQEAVRNIMFAETIMRSEMSAEMTRVNDQEQDFTHANYNYNLDEKKLEKLLGGKIDPKDLKMAKEVLGLIEEDYSGNVDFLNNYGENFIRNKIFPFTLASDELDSTFLSYRSTGQNMLTRAISEIQRVEKEICDEIFGFNELLKETSTNGKNDVSDILKSIHKMKHCVESMHGKEPAHKLAKIMSSLTISFFKRDTVGKAFFGLFGVGRTNSIAAEYAGGRSGAVWEWEAKEGDNFMCEMETKDILSRLPYEKNKKKELAPLWIKNPITGKMIKVPFLKTYKKHFQTTSKDVRKGFGADFKSIAFDMLNKWVPLLLAFILWKFISSAIKESSDEETK